MNHFRQEMQRKRALRRDTSTVTGQRAVRGDNTIFITFAELLEVECLKVGKRADASSVGSLPQSDVRRMPPTQWAEPLRNPNDRHV